MPRLSRAQREAKEAQKKREAARAAADAQTAGLPPGSASNAPPPPSASALSTNQPSKLGNESPAGPSISLRDFSPGVNNRASSTIDQGRASVGAASDMSTSDGSLAEDDELANQTLGYDSLRGAGLEGEDEEEEGGATAAAEGSPEVKCMWEDCGQTFKSLPPFINHLHEDHVGIHKARYACEWSGCPRKGKSQTSRFALLSHLRSHTGEKPFTCPRPECDKSFTRSDALAKHMRVQHNINPITSRGRGGNKDTTHGSGGRASRVKGEEEDDLIGTADDGGDALDDELLGLAEGGAGVPGDIDQSLSLHGGGSSYFTYENLFGTSIPTPGGPDAKPNGVNSALGAPLPEEELGIVRDKGISSNLLLGDDDTDDEALRREDEEMNKILESGRREWIRREREKEKDRDDDTTNEGKVMRGTAAVRRSANGDATLSGSRSGKRTAVAAYDSEEDEGDQPKVSTGAFNDSGKRPRRSSTRTESAIDPPGGGNFGTRSASKNAQNSAAQAEEGAKLQKVYLIEKAKLRMVRRENERIRAMLEELREVEKWEKVEKRNMLEKALGAELGRDVGAIFSPPPSPPF